jgi:hypothetical protein
MNAVLGLNMIEMYKSCQAPTSEYLLSFSFNRCTVLGGLVLKDGLLSGSAFLLEYGSHFCSNPTFLKFKPPSIRHSNEESCHIKLKIKLLPMAILYFVYFSLSFCLELLPIWVGGGGGAGVDSILHLLFKRRGGKSPQSGHISPTSRLNPPSYLHPDSSSSTLFSLLSPSVSLLLLL